MVSVLEGVLLKDSNETKAETNRDKFDQSRVAELSVLYEIASLPLLRSEQELRDKVIENAARSLGVSRFALFLGSRGNRRLLASFGFRDSQKIEKITEQKSPNQFLVELGEDGELGELFMERTGELGNKELRLYRIFASRIEDTLRNLRSIRERKKAEESEEFLRSLLRHDVSNKAQLTQGYHELLREFDLPKKAEEYLEKANKSVRESVDLIEKVRTLRKIGREQSEETDLDSVVKEAINKAEARTSGERIVYEKSRCRVQAGLLLQELLSNVIENALVHSGCDKIRISTRESGDKCILTIEDDGRGIPDEDKRNIFKRGFKKGETGGSGLGMYIVKEIAESYDGSIEVKDSELGGARFDIYLREAK